MARSPSHARARRENNHAEEIFFSRRRGRRGLGRIDFGLPLGGLLRPKISPDGRKRVISDGRKRWPQKGHIEIRDKRSENVPLRAADSAADSAGVTCQDALEEPAAGTSAGSEPVKE